MLHFNCPSPHCSRAAEIFHFRLIRIRSNTGSSIFRLHYAVEHELEKPLSLLWLYCTWTGSRRDFSSLITKPYQVKSARTVKLLILAVTELIPPPELSSRKIAMGIPLHLHEVRIGFNNLVNKYGAVDSPTGKTVNWKYFTTSSPNLRRKLSIYGDHEKFQRDGTRTSGRTWKEKTPQIKFEGQLIRLRI